MTEHWQRQTAIVLLGLLGGGVLVILYALITSDGKVTQGDAGEIAAALLTVREIISKMEKIALGVRTPAPPLKEEI